MRRHGMTTIFGNPGSTEIAFLTDLPADIEFVLALHEGSAVGIATGYALARGEPAFVNLHTAPGLGNAVNAIANARDSRAPLVIVVGQQDRRQIAFEPFLTGRELERLAGEYPVWGQTPSAPRTSPARSRAHTTRPRRPGPALVVPMGDWLEPADELAADAPAHVVRATSISSTELADLVEPRKGRAPRARRWRAAEGPEGWHAVGARRAARRSGLAGAVAVRQLPSGSPAVRGPPGLAAAAHARDA